MQLQTLSASRRRTTLLPTLRTLLFATSSLWLVGCNPLNAAPNLVKNGDFETGDLSGWFNGKGTEFKSGLDSKFAAYLDQSGDTQAQGPGQNVLLPADVKRVRLTMRVKVEGLVKGPAPTNTARIVWQWQDGKGTQVGNWDSLNATENTDWKQLSKIVTAPDGAARMQIFIEIDKRAKGRMWFDDVQIESVAETAPQVTESRTDTMGWYALQPISQVAAGQKPATDLSFLLDAPAGKHGFLEAKNGQFRFADGSRAKFWGLNLGGANLFKMSRESAVQTLDRLAQSGCNMIRLHHMDATFSDTHIFGSGVKPASTRQLSPERLEQLDFFISEAKKRGIYIYLDLLTGRIFGKDDGIAEADKIGVNARVVANFNRPIIELQKEYARQLLTHENQFTGLRLADDPAIALSEVVNESTLFDKWSWANVPKSYQNEFLDLFAKWCAKEGATKPDGTIQELFKAHNELFGRFLVESQTTYFAEMRDFLRSLGVKYPLAGSNWQSFEGDLISSASLDFIDRHTYWDHPVGGWNVTDTFTNQSQVKTPQGWGGPGSIARNRVAGKPFLLSEWNNCRMNEWITEGPLLMSSTAALQDWDGLLQFAYAGGDWRPQMKGIWNSGEQPQNWVPRFASALIFLRGDLAPATTQYIAPIGDSKKLTNFVEDNFPPGLAYQTRVAAAPNAPRQPLPTAPSEKDGNALYQNANGLSWKAGDGIFKLDTPRTQALLGFVGGQKVQLSAVTITPQTPFCQLIVSSLDGKPLTESKRMLLTTTARAENTDTIYNTTRTSMKSEGRGPILMEPVKAALQFAGGKIKVRPLDHNGFRREQNIAVSGANDFSIGAENTFWYEVTRE